MVYKYDGDRNNLEPTFFGETPALKFFSFNTVNNQECHLDGSLQYNDMKIPSCAFQFQGGCGGLASFFFGGKLMVARFRATGARVKGLVAVHTPVPVWIFSQIICLIFISFCSGGISIFVWLLFAEWYIRRQLSVLCNVINTVSSARISLPDFGFNLNSNFQFRCICNPSICCVCIWWPWQFLLIEPKLHLESQLCSSNIKGRLVTHLLAANSTKAPCCSSRNTSVAFQMGVQLQLRGSVSEFLTHYTPCQ